MYAVWSMIRQNDGITVFNTTCKNTNKCNLCTKICNISILLNRMNILDRLEFKMIKYIKIAMG